MLTLFCTFSMQVAARMKQYEDELARKRMMAEHELQRQRNAEHVKLQEDAHARCAECVGVMCGGA